MSSEEVEAVFDERSKWKQTHDIDEKHSTMFVTRSLVAT